MFLIQYGVYFKVNHKFTFMKYEIFYRLSDDLFKKCCIKDYNSTVFKDRIALFYWTVVMIDFVFYGKKSG